MKPSDTAPAPVAPTPAPPDSIAAALLVAQKAIKQVEKGSTNEYHGYDYTSADDMIKCARAALHEAGLTFSLNNHELLPLPEIAAVFEDPGVPPFIFVRSHFLLEHGASGEFRKYTFDLPAIPEKGRPLDKAILGVMTSSWSYMLRDLLQIPREDENEISKRDDTHVEAPRRGPAPTWQQKKAEQQMSAPAPSGPAPSTKAKLWGAITTWTGIQPADTARYAGAGRRVFEALKMDITGQATEQQLNHALIYVNDQIRKKVSFDAWAAEQDIAAEKAEAEAAKPKPPVQTGTVQINDEDIPF